MISLKTHNVIDYIAGVILLFVPSIFGFGEIDAARNVFLGAGIALIAYSLLTQYSYALWRVIPMGVHMSLDVLNGVVIMLAPWIFGYRELLSSAQEILHYALALGVFGLVALTRSGLQSISGKNMDTETYSGSTTYERDRKVG